MKKSILILSIILILFLLIMPVMVFGDETPEEYRYRQWQETYSPGLTQPPVGGDAWKRGDSWVVGHFRHDGTWVGPKKGKRVREPEPVVGWVNTCCDQWGGDTPCSPSPDCQYAPVRSIKAIWEVRRPAPQPGPTPGCVPCN